MSDQRNSDKKVAPKKVKKGLWPPLAFVITAILVLGAAFISLITFALDLVLTILVWILKLVFMAVLFGRMVFRRIFKWLQGQWNYNFTKLTNPNPKCQICGKPASETETVEFSDCCNRWVHDSCHATDSMKKMMGHMGVEIPADVLEALMKM